MSQVKQLLDSLLLDIYGKQQLQQPSARISRSRHDKKNLKMATQILGRAHNVEYLQQLSVHKLIDVCAILKLEIRLMGFFLERVLISRDRSKRHQEILCGFVDAILFVEFHDTHPKMRFSLSPPPPKAAAAAVVTSPTNMLHAAHSRAHNEAGISGVGAKTSMEPPPVALAAVTADADDAASDYNQWLHAMKLVARLPGGMPPEFRRKLWLSLADKYLKSRNVDWTKEQEKCFCEKWREDDEELGIQIVKDLHRTGSNICTGPAGSINQAKLKRILLGYARYNPEVGYCQGFNMLGALILQVMDKEETESMKVMIYLVEGVLPPGYFCGSMGGLQADMGVFRELMQTKLPRLAKHLQKLQGPVENAYEPPLTNVFTMQWFLTMFCTCLPMSCVLRVWDLVLIEGSDVLLRTALVLWGLLEERVLSSRTADDFYGKMGSFSSELLNGHLIDSNGLIEKVVQLGPIPDIQKLRDKHLYNIAPLRHKQGLQLYFDDEEAESDEESRLAVATVWGIPWGRRGSQSPAMNAKQVPESKDRIALDISLLKKQYDRLRERQKQAHIILTTACSTARQGASAPAAASAPSITVPVNQLLLGRPAIVLNKGRRVGAPAGTIPPARKPSLPTILHTKAPEKQLRRGETLHWRDTDLSKRRRDSLTWKEIKADRATLLREASQDVVQSSKLQARIGKSDSSSYSEESGEEEESGSSTDTSLCDEDDPTSTGDKAHSSSLENSPRRRSKLTRKQKELSSKLLNLADSKDVAKERRRPKSWAPSTSEIPFTLMGSESPGQSGDEKASHPLRSDELLKEEEDSATESDRMAYKRVKELNWSHTKYSLIAGDLATTKLDPLEVQTDILELPVITSTSQLSPMPDIVKYLSSCTISPLPTPKPVFLDSMNSLGSADGDGDAKMFDVSDDGVTNQYFERVNSVERPTKLDLFYSLNEEDSIRNAYEDNERKSGDESATKSAERRQKQEFIFKPDGMSESEVYEQQENKKNVKGKEDPVLNRRMELLLDYSEKSSAAFIAQATSELSTVFKRERLNQVKGEEKIKQVQKEHRRDNNIPGERRDDFAETWNKSQDNRSQLSKEQSLSNASRKRRDPRRLTLTRSTTIDIEERFQELERRLSNDVGNKIEMNIDDDNLNRQKPKRIPSTADLEERYNSFEKQLSIKKQVEKETHELVENTAKRKHVLLRHVDKAESTDSGVPISDISDSENMPPSKPSRERIPSTAELDSRFSALERQMSSHSLTAKNAIQLKSSGKKEDKDDKSINRKSAENKEKDADVQEPSSDAKNATSHESNEKLTEEERPRLKKLPSTAELEDRFDALERNKSIQKSPSKTKKEPPDEMLEKPKKISPNLEEVKKNNEEKHTEVQSMHGNAQIKQPKEEKGETKAKDADKVDDRNKTQENHDERRNAEVIKKKPPPSTEELEKRFQALEKQMSTSVEAESEEAQKSKDEKQSLNKESQQDSADTTKIATCSKSNEAQTEKLMKSFEDKCKQINEEIVDKKITKENEETGEQVNKPKERKENSQSKSMEAFAEKCQNINGELVKETVSSENSVKEETAIEVTKEQITAKRRASEPPSTEDLEKRYESLKRRMSSNTKTITERTLSKSKAVEETLETTEKEETVDEDKFIKVKDAKQHKHSEEVIAEKEVKSENKKRAKSSKPPTTEDLESRYEALHQESNVTTEDAIGKKINEKDNSRNEEVPTCATKNMVKQSSNESAAKISTESALGVNKKELDIKKEDHVPKAPPMPKAYSQDNSLAPVNGANNQRRALIEEFESKIKTQPNDENLRPSDINPNRKSTSPIPRRAIANVDDTSEAHADPAFYGRSENYESWQTKKTVRRFSDLPSRADLENRLQFLEKQLSKKFCKLRRASDSEVASRRQLASPQQVPSTSKGQGASVDLEKRVQALEKQLSDNSLKLLDAMRVKTTAEAGAVSESPRKLSTETIDATGKELMRYAQFDELEEGDIHKPINISINIKMMLNKEGEKKILKTDGLRFRSTEELEERLEKLELQLKATKSGILLSTESTEDKMDEIAVNLVPEKQATMKNEKEVVEVNMENEMKVTEILKCANANRNEKHAAENENTDMKDLETEKNSTESTEPKIEVIRKEEKTLENQEISEQQKIKAAKLIEDTEGAKKNIEDHAIKKAHLEREVPLFEHTKEMQEMAKEIEKEIVQETETKKSKTITNAEESTNKKDSSELQEQNMKINASDIGAAEPNNKTLVLLLDNEPKAVKVRRLTRANTEELEGLFQALEKQLSDRNLIKSDDGKLKHADQQQPTDAQNATEESQAISDLTKEITEFTTGDQHNKSANEMPKAEEFDWGMDLVKRHLKRKTVHLPSTKELESRFRSLERQIKLLEDVENIDVEQRLNEIERKIKLQYSLSHEKDLSKYLELCEGKGLDDEPETLVTPKPEPQSVHKTPVRNRAKSPARSKEGSPYASPAREKIKTPYTSPTRAKERRSQHSSTQRDSEHSTNKSPRRQQQPDDDIPSTEDLEYRYRALDLTRSKSKESLDGRSRKKTEFRKQPIHPLEMLLDPSPDDSDIPTTGELEHRMKILEQTGKTPSPTRQSRSRSPTIDDIKRQKMRNEQRPKQPIHNLETLVTSPTKRELPTAEELEARMHALEQEHCFDFKTQKNFKDFNQKLKNVVSPSLSFEEFKMAKSREPSPRRSETQRSSTSKAEVYGRSTSPKVIRFEDEDDEYSRPKSRSDQRDMERRMVGQTDGVLQMIEENSKVLQRILQKTLADSTLTSSYSGAAMAAATSEGLNAMGPRLMRETSPITRTGTHTGVPLRTDDNINERLTSIKNTIKSIDTLCEEKPYRKEKCQRYIDSLFSDSVHFAKKASLEELARSCVQREYAPSIRISDHSQRPSEFYLSRSMGSAESIRSTSPLRAASPLHHRSQRDLRRLDLSPRGRSRLEEEREEYESRVRAVNMLPNNAFHDDNLNSDLGSDLSLIKFHKVDRQLVVDDERERTSSRSASRSPLRSPYGSRETMLMHNTNTTKTTPTTTTTANSNRWEVERAAASPYRQTSHQLLGYSDGNRRSNTPVYSPTKLEIRHTTVTSTFYDRLLTEKQIEKTLSRPSSRSPLVSPSASAKSYQDITADLNPSSYKTANANSPTEPATFQPNTVLGTSALGIGNTPLTTLPNYAASSYDALTTASVLPDSCLDSASKPAQYSATTPTGNSSSYRTAFISDRLPPLAAVASHTDLRIRSCDNILMQLKSTSMTTASAVGVPEPAPLTTVPTAAILPSNNATASAASVSTFGSYSSLLARPNLTTSFSYTPSQAFTPTSTFISTTNCITTSIPASLNFTTSLYSNTAIPNSVMPCNTVTTRPPDDIGNSLHLLYASTLNNNTTTGVVIHADTEGLKM